ncbi:extracellular solute-binding protein [Aquabacterium sp.]|uniref:extracellular solute-binding protein n=1 Tax=Aquabacterium sp. TaxID=1872578 RepID=UPI0035B167FA
MGRFGVLRWLGVALLALAWLPAAWSAHAYAQFGDIKYPAGFHHFDYVNLKAPKGGDFSLVAPVIANNFDKYNPFTLKGTSPPGLTTLMFETLLTGNFEEPSTAYGLLADDVAVASDGLSVTFHLNTKARFNNGDAVLAADVKHSFDVLTSKQVSPQYPAYFGGVSAVKVLDERTIRFEFKRPDKELPLIVGSLPVFSHKWGVVNGKAKPFDEVVMEEPITSGPYRIGPVNSGRDITYVRDPQYWGADLNVRRGQYNFDRVTYRMYLDNVAAFEGFKAGEFDFIESYVSKDWVRQYKGARFDSGELVKKTLPHRNAANFQGFIFNTRLDKFKDPRVREAIGLAMDFEWMNRQLFYGIYKRINSFFTNSDYEAKGLPGPDELALLEPLRAKLPAAVFAQPVPQPPNTNPPGSLRDNLRRARDLLAAAGWTYRDGQLRNAKGDPFTIEFLDNSPNMGRVVTPMIRNLEKLGIQASYRVVDYAVYEKRMKKFDYEMESLALPGQEVPGSELRQYYHSSMANVEGSDNLMGVSDPAVDALIEKVTTARNKPELIVATRALDRVLRHKHLAVMHWYSNTFRVAWRGGRFGQPAVIPPHYRPEAWALSCWWRQ